MRCLERQEANTSSMFERCAGKGGFLWQDVSVSSGLRGNGVCEGGNGCRQHRCGSVKMKQFTIYV